MATRGPAGRTSPEEFVERLKELVATNVAGTTQLVTRFSDFIGEVSRVTGAGERTDVDVLLSRWLDFNLASYSVVSAQSLALMNGLLVAAESTLLPKSTPATPARPSPTPRVELRLAGRHGERPTTGFLIENHFDRPLAVTFNATDLVSKAGAALPASFISFEPPTLVLQPRAQGAVQAAVTIASEFVVGETYTATIRLVGFEAKEVGLSVTVLPPADAVATSSPTGEVAKPAKKRRSRTGK